MNKCTLTFEDNEDGTVAISVDFDPPISKDTQDGTPAQRLVADIVGFIQAGNAHGELERQDG